MLQASNPDPIRDFETQHRFAIADFQAQHSAIWRNIQNLNRDVGQDPAINQVPEQFLVFFRDAVDHYGCANRRVAQWHGGLARWTGSAPRDRMAEWAGGGISEGDAYSIFQRV